jgi:hypothetical protein
MVFVLFMVLAVGAFVNFGNRNQQAVIAEADRNPSSSATSPNATSPADAPVIQPSAVESQNASPRPSPTQSITISSMKVQPGQVERVLDSTELAVLTGLGSAEGFVIKAASVGRATVYDVESETGIRANFALDGQNPAVISNVTVKFSIGDSDYRAFPKQLAQEVNVDAQGNQVITFIGSLDYVLDENDWLVRDLALSRNVVKIIVVIDKNTNQYASSTLQVGSRF